MCVFSETKAYKQMGKQTHLDDVSSLLATLLKVIQYQDHLDKLLNAINWREM